MIPLDDQRWSELEHAYGKAEDIPELLHKLEEFPEHTSDESEPYFSLWSTLCHQGDVYSASYAALPHIVAILQANPQRAHWSVLLLVASIEISRAQGSGPELAADLSAAYFEALNNLPNTIALIATQEWDELYCRVAVAALAAVKGQPDLAEAILELAPDIIPAFQEWIDEQ